MDNLQKAHLLFGKENPNLFIQNEANLSVADREALISSRIAFLKNYNCYVMASRIFPTIMGKDSKMNHEVFESYLARAWNEKRRFTSEPSTKLETDFMQTVYNNRPYLKQVADFTQSFVFGSNNIHDYLAVPEGYKLGSLKYPEKDTRAENVVVNLEKQDLESITSSKIIPLAQYNGRLVLIGKDAQANAPVLFSLTLPDQNAFATEYEGVEMPFMLHVNGLEPKQMGRISYKPSTKPEDLHQQMKVDENGIIQRGKDGVAIKETLLTTSAHFHAYTDTTLVHPRHYSCVIEPQNNNYLGKNPTCQGAIIDLFERFNVAYDKTMVRTTDQEPLPTELTCGAISTLGLNLSDEELADLPITIELYESLAREYELAITNPNHKVDENVTDQIALSILGDAALSMQEYMKLKGSTHEPTVNLTPQQSIETLQPSTPTPPPTPEL